MSAKSKGAYTERMARDVLKALGYYVTKAAGSLGLFDLVAVGPRDVRLVQVKTNRKPSALEMDRIRDFGAEQTWFVPVHKEVWVHVRRRGWDIDRIGKSTSSTQSIPAIVQDSSE